VNYKRADRVGDVVRAEISNMVLKDLKDPRIGMVTITRVKISDDLKTAKVFFSVIGDEKDREKSKQGLERASGFIKRELGKRLRLKYLPDIKFIWDDSIEYGIRISKMLEKLKEESNGV